MQRVWAQIIGEPEEWSPTCHLGIGDFEEAAQSQVADFISATGGDTKVGAVLVWAGEGASRVEKVYDCKADFTVPDAPELEDGDEMEIEVEGSIELIQRS